MTLFKCLQLLWAILTQSRNVENQMSMCANSCPSIVLIRRVYINAMLPCWQHLPFSPLVFPVFEGKRVKKLLILMSAARSCKRSETLFQKSLLLSYWHGESTSAASQLTSPASQKSNDLNKVLLLLQDLVHNYIYTFPIVGLILKYPFYSDHP